MSACNCFQPYSSVIPLRCPVHGTSKSVYKGSGIGLSDVFSKPVPPPTLLKRGDIAVLQWALDRLRADKASSEPLECPAADNLPDAIDLEQFVLWMRVFITLEPNDIPSQEQWAVIKEMLKRTGVPVRLHPRAQMPLCLSKEQQAALAEEMKNAMPGTIVMVDDPADLPTRLAE